MTGTTPPAADWMMTGKCRLTCDFCHGQDHAVSAPAEIMSGIAEALTGSKIKKASICGGEPLDVRDVDLYAGRLRQAGKRVTLNTNGLSLMRRIRSQRGFDLSSFSRVGFSIHGSTQPVQLAMQGEGTDLDAILAGAEHVAGLPNVELKVASLITQVNCGDILGLARLVKRLRPDDWRILEYAEQGPMNTGHTRHPLPEGKFQELVALATAEAAPVTVTTSSAEGLHGCLLIDPFGNVMLPMGDLHVRQGNVLETPLDEIWQRMSSRGRHAVISHKTRLSAL